MRPIRVLAVWRHRVLGEALAASLGGHRRISVTATTGDPGAASRHLSRQTVDVVLVDASMETAAAIELTARLKEEFPAARLLPFGVPDLDAALSFIEAGASSYLSNEASLADVIEAVGEIHHGRQTATMAFAARVVSRIEELTAGADDRALQPPPRESPLSERELEVLTLVARGLANKEIAQRMGIRTATVKNHVHAILQKLEVARRREAVRAAYERRLLRGPLRWRVLEDEDSP